MVQTQEKQSTQKRCHSSATLSATYVTRTGLHSPYFFITPNFMKQSSSWEANRFSASQEIPRILWNPKVHYSIHKSTLPVRILSQIYSVHAPNPLPEDPVRYCSPIYARVFLMVSLPQISPPKHCMHLFSLPYVLRAPPISFSLNFFVTWILNKLIRIFTFYHVTCWGLLVRKIPF
jgi:hypothetical protein